MYGNVQLNFLSSKMIYITSEDAFLQWQKNHEKFYELYMLMFLILLLNFVDERYIYVAFLKHVNMMAICTCEWQRQLFVLRNMYGIVNICGHGQKQRDKSFPQG